MAVQCVRVSRAVTVSATLEDWESSVILRYILGIIYPNYL